MESSSVHNHFLHAKVQHEAIKVAPDLIHLLPMHPVSGPRFKHPTSLLAGAGRDPEQVHTLSKVSKQSRQEEFANPALNDCFPETDRVTIPFSFY